MVPEKRANSKKRANFTMCATDLCLLCDAKLASDTCILPCGHVFCQLCVSRFCARSTTCPSCRAPFTRLQEVVEGEPTGFYFSARALRALYSEGPVPADSALQKVPEQRRPTKQPPPSGRVIGATRFAPLQLPLVFGWAG
jgi:hypothetical protein